MRTHGHRGWKGRGGWQRAETPSTQDAAAWFAGAGPIPEAITHAFVSAPEATIDREEILILGELPPLAEDFDDAAARAAAESGRISRFREDTRESRIEIARQAEHRYQRKVAWGARVGGTRELFTTLSVPVMTRLRQPERQVLDTLVDSGVARSRSEALAWAVRLVGEHAETWLSELRTAMSKVDDLRAEGPDLD